VNYADRLEESVRRCGNACLVGLDPHLDLIPEEFPAARDPAASRGERAAAVGDFLCAVVELVAGRVPAVKPQSAFFEALGADGAVQWERVVRTARESGLLVIGDVKRGDIGSTAAAYATAFLEGLSPAGDGSRCDAITVNPFLGTDSVRPFLETCARTGTGIYVLVRTSNPSSAEFQAQGHPTLSERVADAVARWGDQPELVGRCGLSSVGAVVGATHAAELARLRQRMPRTPFLLPGYGAQGAGAGDVAVGFLAGGRGALVNASRSVLFAYRQSPGEHWQDASITAVDRMAREINAALAARA
jgi:orotidine-5'-phosphate decarboxylase